MPKNNLTVFVIFQKYEVNIPDLLCTIIRLLHTNDKVIIRIFDYVTSILNCIISFHLRVVASVKRNSNAIASPLLRKLSREEQGLGCRVPLANIAWSQVLGNWSRQYFAKSVALLGGGLGENWRRAGCSLANNNIKQNILLLFWTFSNWSFFFFFFN